MGYSAPAHRNRTRTVLRGQNKYVNENEQWFLVIATKRGEYKARLDDIKQVERARQKHWSVEIQTSGNQDTIYFIARHRRLDGRETTTRLHRHIVCASQGEQVEADTLQRVSTIQNSRSARVMQTYNGRSTHSKYKGVDFVRDKVRARIQMRDDDGRARRITVYRGHSEIEAAKAYDRAALQRDPVFNLLNFPELRDEYLRSLQQ